MSPERMREIGLRLYKEVLTQGKLEVADELVAADCIDLSPRLPSVVGRTGPAPLKYVAAVLRCALSDLHVRVHEVLIDGNTAIARITIEGQHTGDFLGVPPTGHWLAWDAIDLLRMREGAIREHYGLWDEAGLLEQLLPFTIPEPSARWESVEVSVE